MIGSMDRSGWIGASDSYMVMANRDTKTWKAWWSIKLGAENTFYGTSATRAGNTFEHSIINEVQRQKETFIKWDEQYKIDKLRLRVNYDGIDHENNVIYEIKTHRGDKDFLVTDAYYKQAQVEMFCYKKTTGVKPKLYIVSYALQPDEYDIQVPRTWIYEGKLPIDPMRMSFTEVKYDRGFVKGHYLPNLKQLAKELDKEMPLEELYAD